MASHCMDEEAPGSGAKPPAPVVVEAPKAGFKLPFKLPFF